jgi:hypothetical protein
VFIKIREIGLNQFYQFVENVGFKKNQKLRKFENSKIKKPNGKKTRMVYYKASVKFIIKTESENQLIYYRKIDDYLVKPDCYLFGSPITRPVTRLGQCVTPSSPTCRRPLLLFSASCPSIPASSGPTYLPSTIEAAPPPQHHTITHHRLN